MQGNLWYCTAWRHYSPAWSGTIAKSLPFWVWSVTKHSTYFVHHFSPSELLPTWCRTTRSFLVGYRSNFPVVTVLWVTDDTFAAFPDLQVLLLLYMPKLVLVEPWGWLLESHCSSPSALLNVSFSLHCRTNLSRIDVAVCNQDWLSLPWGTNLEISSKNLLLLPSPYGKTQKIGSVWLPHYCQKSTQRWKFPPSPDYLLYILTENLISYNRKNSILLKLRQEKAKLFVAVVFELSRLQRRH